MKVVCKWQGPRNVLPATVITRNQKRIGYEERLTSASKPTSSSLRALPSAGVGFSDRTCSVHFASRSTIGLMIENGGTVVEGCRRWWWRARLITTRVRLGWRLMKRSRCCVPVSRSYLNGGQCQSSTLRFLIRLSRARIGSRLFRHFAMTSGLNVLQGGLECSGIPATGEIDLASRANFALRRTSYRLGKVSTPPIGGLHAPPAEPALGISHMSGYFSTSSNTVCGPPGRLRGRHTVWPSTRAGLLQLARIGSVSRALVFGRTAKIPLFFPTPPCHIGVGCRAG